MNMWMKIMALALRKASWEQRLQRAEQVGTFQGMDYKLAGNWQVCAVGERFHLERFGAAANPRGLLGSGEEMTEHQVALLDDKGMDFYGAVLPNNVSKARKAYEEIKGLALQTQTNQTSTTLKASTTLTVGGGELVAS